MSFLNIGQELQDTYEEKATEEGEYLVRIVSAEIREDKGFMLVRFEIVDDPYAKEIMQILNLPGAGRTPKEENRNRLRLGYLFSAFDIDPSGTYDVSMQQPEGFVGREGWALIGPPEDDGKGYGPQNKIKRFVSGHK